MGKVDQRKHTIYAIYYHLDGPNTSLIQCPSSFQTCLVLLLLVLCHLAINSLSLMFCKQSKKCAHFFGKEKIANFDLEICAGEETVIWLCCYRSSKLGRGPILKWRQAPYTVQCTLPALSLIRRQATLFAQHIDSLLVPAPVRVPPLSEH